MINIGEVYCDYCADPFEPEGIASFEGPNYCSDDCEEWGGQAELNQNAYDSARYGSAPVFE